MSYNNQGRSSPGIPHHIEYSKSSKAKCCGPPPCQGSNIAQGTLRYGRTVANDFGETVQWMHWGCVSSHILGELAAFGIQSVPHFEDLRSEDKNKIRLACAMRRVDPADIPESAKVQVVAPPTPASSQGPSSSQPPSSSQGPPSSQPMPSSQTSIASVAPTLSQKKRKAAMEAAQGPSMSGTGLASLHHSGPRATPIGVRRLNVPAGTTWEEGSDDEVEIMEPVDELYCTLNTNIVGVQYYKGMVGAGENVDLVREPTNKYDRNAIQVKNIMRVQVGHIPRDIASKLAPLMDRKLITVEGIMQAGNQRGFQYALAMTLKIYGPSDKRSSLEPLLIWATPGKRGFPQQTTASSSSARGGGLPSSSQGTGGGYGGSGSYASQSASYGTAAPYASSQPPRSKGLTPSQKAAQQEQIRKQQEAAAKAQELRMILNNLEKVDDEGRRSGLMDSLCSAEDVLLLPLHANPPGIESGELTVDLLKHQKQALQWCIEHEYPSLPKKEEDKPVQFWQYKNTGGKPFYLNLATKTPQVAPPILGRGALCADSMGLGKTLTMIALILATKKDSPPDYSKSSLIVVPLSIISNWEKQIQDHCKPGALSYAVYYGTNRSLSPQDLQKFDIVITTYQTVSGEYANSQGIATGHGTGAAKKKKKGENSLFGVQWKRIILDEGHNIRNPRTKMAQGVFALSAQRRWVLTGTPIINSPEDLGSILRFLRICSPLDNGDYYKRLVLRPLKDGDPAGAEILRALMAQICIRRTKEMQDSQGNYLVPLPPVDMTLVPVTLTPEARQLYDVIEELAKAKIEGFMNAHGLANVSVSTNALSMLTRLRQLALHPGLVPADYVEQLRKSEEDSDSTVEISPEERIRLQALLAQAIEDNEECPICFDILNDPRITPCTHRFCMPCISEVIARDPKCPMDRRTIGMDDLIEPPPVTELTQARARTDEDEDDAMDELRTGSSAKIDQLVHLLKLTPPTEKSLVFSQFTSFLDKIAESLEVEGIPYVRFDGQMSARRRQETLEAFSIPLTEANASVTVTPTPSQASTPAPSQAPVGSQRSSRRRASARIATIEDAEVPLQDEGGDEDFLPTAAADDDDDFLDDDDDDDDSAWTKKGKGKSKAKGKGKAKASRARFSTVTSTMTYNTASTGVNPKVLLISLKAGALGLNLTVANNVYLMDPWWQEGIESQAIDRCNRIGQTKPVHVYQLIAENTVESKVMEIQEKKKQLIKQAFSGMKSKETERQKKEARLQDLVQLFGIRLAASQNPTAENA